MSEVLGKVPVKRIEIYVQVASADYLSALGIALYERVGLLPGKLLLDAGKVKASAAGILQVACDIVVELHNLPFICIRTGNGALLGALLAFSSRYDASRRVLSTLLP